MNNNKQRFIRFASNLAERGYTVFLPEYRVFKEHGTTLHDAVADAKEAVRLYFQEAKRYGLDQQRLSVGGASAGGHLALCACVLRDIRDSFPGSFHSAVLFNPVLCVSHIGEYYQGETGVPIDDIGICPAKDAAYYDVPLLIMHGTSDQLVCFEDSRQFCRQYQEHGGNCYLEAYSGRGHAFHLAEISELDYQSSLNQLDRFLSNVSYAPAK